MQNNIKISDLELLGCRVLIEPIEEEQKSFVIPSSKDKSSFGKVVIVGDGIDKDKTYTAKFVVNNIVIFKRWAGSSISLAGKEYIQVNWSDVEYIVGGK